MTIKGLLLALTVIILAIWLGSHLPSEEVMLNLPN